MKQKLFQLIGILLIVTAVGGSLLSFVGLFTIWKINHELTVAARETTETIDTILHTTIQGLIVTDESLGNAISNLDALKLTLLSTGEAINSTTPLISSFSNIITEELPDTLIATQTSLTTAQSSARLIENVLTSVTGIPFFPGEPYRPETPLHITLGEVSESLDPLAESLLGMRSGLSNTQTNLLIIDLEMKVMSRHITHVNASLADARKVVNEYQDGVAELQEQSSVLNELVSTWVNTFTWLFTFGFVWLGFAQLGLVIQGYQLIKFS